VESATFGSSVEGREIAAKILGDGPNVTAIIGGLHGDEPSGQGVATRLIQYLLAHPDELEGHRVIVAPAVNPDGLHRNTRTNAHGVDVNRNFDSGDWQPGEKGRYYPGRSAESEPETRAIVQLLQDYQPQKVIALHAPMRMLNPTGSGVEVARAMRAANGYRASEDIGYATPGSFGTYCGTRFGLMMVTLELPEGGTDRAWAENKEALLAAIRYPGEGPAATSETPAPPPKAPDKEPPKVPQAPPTQQPPLTQQSPPTPPPNPPSPQALPAQAPTHDEAGSRWRAWALFAIGTGLLVAGSVLAILSRQSRP
jgi:protein MpaA